ncbi:MAG: hypothetical protein ACJA0F_002404 [Dinoroseobacter sp.]|jgi:hypothetical protein
MPNGLWVLHLKLEPKELQKDKEISEPNSLVIRGPFQQKARFVRMQVTIRARISAGYR